MSPAAAESSLLCIALGSGQDGLFDVGVPVLAGEPVEQLFRAARSAGKTGQFVLFRMDDWVLGAATVRPAGDLEDTARRLYHDLFAAAHGLHLARIWNYVPAINETGAGGLENYRVFCRGRSLAFEENYGAAFKTMLPAASAVGCSSGALTVLFAASPTVPRHIENPLQVPAYDYPSDYGPRAPSFARATVVAGAKGASVFISGTAAIRGHATVAPGELHGQLDCALENLREISAACALGPAFDRNGASARHFKVYLRHASDLPVVAARLDREILTPQDSVSYVQADICRATLRVEIEATLFGVKSGA